MKKKALVVGLCLITILSVNLFAAGQGDSAQQGATPTNPVTFRGGHTGTPDWQFHIALEEWASLVEDRTDGAVIIEVFPSEQLGTERELLERTNLGAIDWSFVGSGGATEFAPEFAMFENAFTFKSLDHFENVAFNRDFRDKLAAELESNSNMTFLGLSWNGIRNVISTVPFRTPAEADGLRLRVPDVPTFRIVAYAVGATATPLPFGEVYLALQQGVVDAAEGSPENMVNMKFVEVAQNYILTEHMLQGTAHFFNKDAFYGRLSEEQQEIVIDSAFEVMHERFNNGVAVQQEYLEQMRNELGINIIELTPAEKARFQERAYERLEEVYIPQWGSMWDEFLALAD